MSEKERIDVLMYNKGMAESREKAKRLVMAGNVFIDNVRVDKPGTKVDVNSAITLKGNMLKYVGRGGYKLEKALKCFDINILNSTAVDIGASTGGFTDCLIQNGAKKVYSIDVGYGQLDWKLRNNDKVTVLERTNFRYIDSSIFKEQIDVVVIDVSFISLKNILPKVREISNDDTTIITLIKPQFEAGRDKVGKKGVVKNKEVHLEVLNNILQYCMQNNMYIDKLTYSPIKGAEGNIEYLALIKNKFIDKIGVYNLFQDVVNESFNSL